MAEREQVLQWAHEALLALSYDDASGIPGIRKTLADHGLTLNIQIDVSIGEGTPAEQPGPDPDIEGELEEWRNFGIRMDDLREVAEIQARRSEEREEVLVHLVRTLTPSLSTRGRNYTWGWLNLHYPEIGLDENPQSVRDRRFRLLSDPEYWRGIVEAALGVIKTRADRFDVLNRLLTTLRFAQEHT